MRKPVPSVDGLARKVGMELNVRTLIAGWTGFLGLLAGAMAVPAGARSVEPPSLGSQAVLVLDQQTGKRLVEKRADSVVPIASLTKLMTAMVILDAHVDLREPITITAEDVDTLRHSRSRLPVHAQLSREEALRLALMASENRAAHALGRTFPGGLGVFVSAMNAKARQLNLGSTRFEDPAGLGAGNVSSANDLAKLVEAASRYSQIRVFTTCEESSIQFGRGAIPFHNSNRLVRNSHWEIGLSKTGYINEAGRCLVMQAQVGHRPTVIVLLDGDGNATRFQDANRIKQWLEGTPEEPAVQKTGALVQGKGGRRASRLVRVKASRRVPVKVRGVGKRGVVRVKAVRRGAGGGKKLSVRRRG